MRYYIEILNVSDIKHKDVKKRNLCFKQRII